MLVLYHGDTSVCSAKVRLALAEKGLDWTSRLLDLQRQEHHSLDYVKLNPARVVPTLVHADLVVRESSIILDYLEDRFPQPTLMPACAHGRALARLWLRRVDDLHVSCSTLSSAVKLHGLRNRASVEKIESYLNSISDDAKRRRQRRLIDGGFEIPEVVQALKAFDRFAEEMQDVLIAQTFLCGDLCTLADLAVLPYIDRAENLGLCALWETDRPAVGAWLARMKKRPSYAEGILRWRPEGSRKYEPSQDLLRLLYGQHAR